MQKTKPEHYQEMEVLQRLREAVVGIAHPWLPYGRWIRCNPKKKQCINCAAAPGTKPHGPYIRLKKALPGRKKLEVNLGPASIDLVTEAIHLTKMNGRRLTSPRLIDEGLISSINQTFPENMTRRELNKWLKNGNPPQS